MTEPMMTGSPATPEPGAIVFFPNPYETGYTEEEAIRILRGAPMLPASGLPEDDGFTAAADVQTGAMIALIPSINDRSRFTVANGEPVDQLHITQFYLGEADFIDDDTRAAILNVMADFASRQPVIATDVFAFSVFNPAGVEPCLVAMLSGVELADAHTSILTEIEENDLSDVEQHSPWVAHMTLIYEADPRKSLTDELVAQAGPIVIDTLRVAFAGEVFDMPLGGGLTAAVDTAFHLPGKHDQSTHGRGGFAASEGEIRAGTKLNAGKALDMNDPEERMVAEGMIAWVGGSDYGTSPITQGGILGEIHAAYADPTADTHGASLLRATAGAPANSPKLHRGMGDVKQSDVPQEGDVFDLGMTSFTSSPGVAEGFARPEMSSMGSGTQVFMHAPKKTRALKVHDDYAGKYKDEKEWISTGRFKVTKVKQSTVSVKSISGQAREVTRYDVDIEMVDPSQVSITKNRYSPVSESTSGGDMFL